MSNKLVWVDIPVTKLDRAIRFYSAALGSEVEKVDFPGMSIGSFPHKHGEVAGSLYVADKYKPSVDGPLIYLNAHGRLDEAIEAAVASGGQLLQPKESMEPFGFRAVILDTEGNRIALHSL
jgi:uncharacterized protein